LTWSSSSETESGTGKRDMPAPLTPLQPASLSFVPEGPQSLFHRSRNFQTLPRTSAAGRIHPQPGQHHRADAHAPCAHHENLVREKLREQFSGKIWQLPPMYSALWKDGKRLYTYARKGMEVERTSREVVVHDIRLVSFQEGPVGAGCPLQQRYVRDAHSLTIWVLPSVPWRI
jgi:hypothetical protein